jgi:hypothetical protein
MLTRLRYVVDADGGNAEVLVRAGEIAITVPVQEEADVLATASAAQIAGEAKRQLDEDGGLEEVLLRPESHTGQFFVASVELDRFDDGEAGAGGRTEIVWVVLEEFVERSTLFLKETFLPE